MQDVSATFTTAPGVYGYPREIGIVVDLADPSAWQFQFAIMLSVNDATRGLMSWKGQGTEYVVRGSDP